jgi:hypothetical protein
MLNTLFNSLLILQLKVSSRLNSVFNSMITQCSTQRLFHVHLVLHSMVPECHHNVKCNVDSIFQVLIQATVPLKALLNVDLISNSLLTSMLTQYSPHYFALCSIQCGLNVQLHRQPNGNSVFHSLFSVQHHRPVSIQNCTT